MRIKEIWKPIKGYEGLYEISNYGQVKSNKREGTKGLLMKPLVVPLNDYYKVKLCKNGKERKYSIHRLVAETFVPNPNDKPQVNHKNGNKHDNYFENLEWVTCSENLHHAYRTGLRKTRKVVQILDDKIIKIYRNCHKASADTGIGYPNIYYVLHGRNKFAGGYEWYYFNTPKVKRLLEENRKKVE